MFRKGGKEDWRAVYEMICDMENTWLPEQGFRAIYEAQLDNDLYYCLVSESSGEVEAVMNLRLEEQLHHAGKIAEIMEFVVGKPYRNSGLGSEMFDYACGLARMMGCGQIEVCSNQLRKDAHRFYEKQGMKNYHFKYTMPLEGSAPADNRLGI